MTENLPALAFDAFVDQIETVRNECTMNSPVPLTEYPAIVVISFGMLQVIEKAMTDCGMLPPCYVIGPKFTYRGVNCVAINAFGIWCAARVF